MSAFGKIAEKPAETWTQLEQFIWLIYVRNLSDDKNIEAAAAELTALATRVEELEALLKEVAEFHLNGCPEPDSADWYHQIYRKLAKDEQP